MSKEKEKGKLDESEKDEKKKTKSASPLDSKKKAVAELAASLFLVEWTNTALDVYVKQIRQNYLKPLKEHVTRLKEDEQKDENQSIVARLREATEKLNDWEDSHRRSQYTRKMTTVGEAAAMYRLRVLHEVCTSLLDILRRLIDWNNGNIKIIRRHTKKLTLLPYANTMIEATAAIGEIFRLESIDLSSVKAEHRKYVRKPRADDYKRSGSQAEKLEIKSAEEYTPTLETQINHYRSATYLIGNSLISIIKIMTRVMTRDIIHIESSEVVRILHRLPPMYLRVDPFELSSYNEMILGKPPPNARRFPLAPRGKSDKTIKSGKSTKNANNSKKSRKSGGSKWSSMSASAKGAAKAAAFVNPGKIVPVPQTTFPTLPMPAKKGKKSLGKRIASKLSKNSRGSTNPKTTQGSPKKGSEVGGGKAEQKQAGSKGKKAKKNATKKK